MFNSNYPVRKKNRMEGYDYSSEGAYFVTICLKNKVQILWEDVGANMAVSIEHAARLPLSEYGEIVDSAINNISLHYSTVFVDKYVIMPDHIHMIICICEKNGQGTALPGIITQLKGIVTKKLGFSIWQKSYHDHIIRNEHDYKEICRYIEENPLKLICRGEHCSPEK